METGHANKSLNQTSGAQEGNGGESLAREGKQFFDWSRSGRHFTKFTIKIKDLHHPIHGN